MQVPGIVAMELLVGCRNLADLQRTQQFLNSFTVVWPEAGEFAQAYELLAALRLTSGLSIPDCLIAAIALARSARLYTFNLKHFRVIAGLDAQEPYIRS
jgi:predicted nucleic acid-binding protein